MAKRETITIDGRVYAKFILYPKEIRDGTHRCIACGQIDEPECHDPKCCPACSETPASEDKAVSAADNLVAEARKTADSIDRQLSPLIPLPPELSGVSDLTAECAAEELRALASALEISEAEKDAFRKERDEARLRAQKMHRRAQQEARLRQSIASRLGTWCEYLRGYGRETWTIRLVLRTVLNLSRFERALEARPLGPPLDRLNEKAS